jgi:hypothetical protein
MIRGPQPVRDAGGRGLIGLRRRRTAAAAYQTFQIQLDLLDFC